MAHRADIIILDPELRRLAVFDTAVAGSGLGPITVTDAAGDVQLTSDPNLQNRPNLSTLPEFQIHKSNPDAGLILTGPTQSRLTGEPIIRMTRRIQTADGSFAGIVYGSIRLAHFRALFDRLRFDDGIALNCVPSGRDAPDPRAGPAAIARAEHPCKSGPCVLSGACPRRVSGTVGLDGVDRVNSFANLDDLPLIVTVATDVDSIREVWIYKAAIVGILILSLCVLTSG